MIERLQRVIDRLDTLPAEAQEEIASELEAMTRQDAAGDATTVALWREVVGSCSDLAWDDELAAIDVMRHEVPPTPGVGEC